ncbi:sigma 54-interacting transcriptional regulator [Clostridiaceae bacterium 35-E11]
MHKLHKDDEKKIIEEIEELRIQNRALRIIFEDAFECIVMVDAGGYITMMNETYANFLGVEVEEVIGKPVTEVIENTRLHIVMKTGEPEIGQLQGIKGYDSVTMRVPITRNGNIVGAIGKVIYKDVKEVKMLAKKLEAAIMELNYYKGCLKKTQGNYFSLDNIVGNNIKIMELKRMVMRMADTDSTVLITGESGTGKEVFANAIHEMSSRRNNNFVKINCAAIPENILESELFGYEDGAFTGAKRGGKVGKFELANLGTIFLDEIGDMSFDMQAKILRVLQEKEIERVGGNTTKKVDVKIIAATNHNLLEKMKKGEFREDLFYRLNVINFELPPLRERPKDIPLLCEFFLQKYNNEFGIYIEKIEEEAMVHLKKYTWPGNIRELQNVIERAYNVVEGNIVTIKHLPERILENSKNSPSGDLNKILNEVEKQTILQTLEFLGGNKSKAAEVLGINRASLYQKLKKHGL